MKSQHTLLLPLTLAVLGLALASCSSDSEGTTDGTSAGTTTESATTDGTADTGTDTGEDVQQPDEDVSEPVEDIQQPDEDIAPDQDTGPDGPDTQPPVEEIVAPDPDTGPDEEVEDPDTGCIPACDSKNCGDDGCGGSCGECGDGLVCTDGLCAAGCQPQCDGMECGEDGCGGNCGYCNAASPVCKDGQCLDYCPTCTLTGKVVAPQGTIPISGALVYATQIKPDPFPDGVFCDTCLDLPQGTPFALTNPTGDFSLGVPAVGEWFIVVQKGTFRKIRTVVVEPGGATLTGDVTKLPSKADAAKGDEIPRMAVVVDSFDSIEDTLEKLGLDGSASFDQFDSFDSGAFFSNTSNLAQYQIIFMPCDTDWFTPEIGTAVVQDALREWVAAGGRLYITDWSYDIMKSVFPDPIQWIFDDGSNGSAQLSGSYDAPAQIIDNGLDIWLDGQGLDDFELEASWTIIEGVSPYMAPDVDGSIIEMQPKVWMNVAHPVHGSRPATVSFQWGCGRGMFSSYHTEAGSTLLPQEKTLAYILFEVAVCTDTKYND